MAGGAPTESGDESRAAAGRRVQRKSKEQSLLLSRKS